MRTDPTDVQRLHAGLLRLDTCDPQDAEAVDGALDELIPVLGRVDDAVPLLDEALFLVALAGDHVGRLEEGVAAIDRLRRLPTGIDPVEIDVAAAELAESRMWRDDDPALAGAAARLFGAAHRGRPYDPQLANRYAEMLLVQAEYERDPALAGLAADVLSDPDAADEAEARATAWSDRAEALHLRAELGGPSSPDVDGCLAAAAAAADVAGPDGRRRALRTRGRRMELLAESAESADSTPSPSTWVRAEALLADAVAVLTGPLAATDPPAARAETAMQGCRLEFALSGEGEVHEDRIRLLYTIAADHPAPPPGWDLLLATTRSLLDTVDMVVGGDGGTAGTSGLLSALQDDDTVLGPELASAVAPTYGVLALLEAIRNGDRAQLLGARDLLRRIPEADRTAELPSIIGIADLLLGIQSAQGLPEAETAAGLATIITEVDRLLEMPAVGPSSEAVRTLAGVIRTMLAPDGAPAVAPLPGSEGAGAHATGMRAIAPVLEVEVALRRAPDHRSRVPLLARLAELVGSSSVLAARAVGTATLARYWTDAARTGADPGARGEAVRWSRAALAALPGLEHPQYPSTAWFAAEALRLRDEPGDRREARRIGSDALRATTWRVLSQATDSDALVGARTAAAKALVLARWCLADGALDDVVAALESGRGLVLYAALTDRDVATQLRARGHEDLAARWERAGGRDDLDGRFPDLAGLHGDLRDRVLDALADGDAGLLDPPGMPEIRAALLRHGSDALVYLAPGDGTEPGLAVVVPARDQVEVVVLPGLHDAPGGPVDVYVRAYEAARTDPDSPELRARWNDALGVLTTWSAGTVTDEVLRVAAGTAADPGRLRLVLVPVGWTTLVPWHAAAAAGDGGPIGARLAISTSPSARLLCRSVARPRVTGGGELVVGDPAGNLRSAREETRALIHAFYRDADYIGVAARGVRASATGTRADLLERLDVGRPRSVVHLACHAEAVPDAPGRSALVLADGRVTVAELVAHRRTAALPLDTVVLAACSTHVGGAAYDEAFSLATAFLAAGARTVIGSLWPVPDGHTSVLMFLVHHHLRAGASPAEAMRRARTWALDPDREPAPGMPGASGAGARGGAGGDLPGGDLLAWSGFVHVGA